MTGGRAQRPQRKAVFLGCEGESEQSYAALLKHLADARGVALHFVAPVLAPGAGDPLQMVLKAARLLEKEQARRGRGNGFLLAAVLLDGDRRGDDPMLYRKAEREAAAAGLTLIIQEPNHEAFLLRHLPGHHHLRPARSDAMARLTAAWPAYRKGLPATRLAERIGWDGLRALAATEPAFHLFLSRLGLSP